MKYVKTLIKFKFLTIDRYSDTKIQKLFSSLFRNFFIFLAAFPKVIVCGLKGMVSGIGVSMLPLFDVVIAESSTKFSLAHSMIGSNVEGISILQASNKINANIVSVL